MYTTVCICYQFKAWIPTWILTSGSTSLCWSGFFKKPKRSHIKLTHSASDVFSLLPMRNFCYSWHHVVLWYGCFGSAFTFAHISLTEQVIPDLRSILFPMQSSGRGRFLTMQNKINNKSLYFSEQLCRTMATVCYRRPSQSQIKWNHWRGSSLGMSCIKL